jgi:hypothetical protein
MWRKKGDSLLVVKVLAFIVSIQALINLAWLLGINPAPSMPFFYDRFKGSFKSMTFLAYWTVFVYMICFALLVRYRGKYRKLAVFFLFIVSGLFLGTFTKHAVLYIFSGGTLWFLLFEKSGMLKKTLILSIALLVAVGLGALTFKLEESSGEGTSYWTSIQYRMERLPRTLKAESYKSTFIEAPKEYPMPLIGAGPGNAFDVIGVQYNTYYARKYYNYIYLTYTGRLKRFEAGGGSVLNLPDCGLLAIYSSLGPIGWALYYGLYVYVAKKIFRAVRSGYYQEKLQELLASTTVVSIVLFLMFNLLVSAFSEHTLTATIWVLIGLVWPMERENSCEKAGAGGVDVLVGT